MAKSITFIVTKDCQLACKYCYLVGKNSKERMPFGIAKRAIDYILGHRDIFDEEAVTWDFIGGEPFLEIDLIDQICDYLKTEMFRLNHPWFNSYMFNFSTNGINFDSEKVQRLWDGIDQNKLRPFLTLDRTTQSPQKCLDCEVASGCAWCQGENYDAADTPTIYQRSTAICKMHKARVRANNYYWNKLNRKLSR